MFDWREAISVLEAKGATQVDLTSFWRLDDAVEVEVEQDKWLAKVYLSDAPPDTWEMADQWNAVGTTVQSLKHFLRLWTEPTRPVPGSYGQ